MALAAKRAEWEELGAALGDFVDVRGGGWTEKHKGTPADCTVGQARPQTKAFCRAYSLPIMASYAYSRYGEEAAARLATAWCHRLQYFYDIWVAADDPDYKFSHADVDAYIETEEFQAFVEGVGVGAIKERLSQLRALRPRLG